MHSVADLTTFSRRTTGEVPPTLVGASTTVVGNKVYLFGGRLVAERQMVSDLYVFDMDTFAWTRLRPHPGDDVPSGRYFHSTEAWNNHLVVFGGMGQSTTSPSADDLSVLNDVRLYDIAVNRWLPAHTTNTASAEVDPIAVPIARYAHLSSITSNCLYVIGGQDLNNLWLDEVHVYSLTTRRWVARRDFPLHCGAYRSVAVSSTQVVRYPTEEKKAGTTPQHNKLLGPPGTRFKVDKIPSAEPECSPSESLVYPPHSAAPNEEWPADIYLYSNWNFTDVKRELEVISPLPAPLHGPGSFAITDKSDQMTGTGLPPGLRFPTGAVLGSHLIVAGTYLAHTYQSFSIWALDLTTLSWSRIDPGSTLSGGSWARAVLQPSRNRFIIFGNRAGNLVDDYTRRLLSWDDVACVDLEAFGIYQPPSLLLDPVAQELGLSALEEGAFTDFEILCDDGRRIACSRALLEERWPWFREQRVLFERAAQDAARALPSIPAHIPLPDISLVPTTPTPTTASSFSAILNPDLANPLPPLNPDPRLTPRSFKLSEPYPITLALLQYFYSMSLITPLQNAPAVLSQLLLLASTYKLHHLEKLVRHAMHRALSGSTCVGIYEVATLCGAQSLQIRALKAVMQSTSHRSKGRSRSERSGGGGSGKDGGSGGGRDAKSDYSSSGRPRGTSDAGFMHPGEGQSGVSTYKAGYTANDMDFSESSSDEQTSPMSGPRLSYVPPRPTSRTIVVDRSDYVYQDENTVAVPDTPRPFMGLGDNGNASGYFELLKEKNVITEEDEEEEDETDAYDGVDASTERDVLGSSISRRSLDTESSSSHSSHRRYGSLAPSVSLSSLRRVATDSSRTTPRRRPVSVGSSSLYSISAYSQSEDGEHDQMYRTAPPPGSSSATPTNGTYMPFHLPRRKQTTLQALTISQSNSGSNSTTVSTDSDTPSLMSSRSYTSIVSAQSTNTYLSPQSSPRVATHPSIVLPPELTHAPQLSGSSTIAPLSKIDELAGDEEISRKSSMASLTRMTSTESKPKSPLVSPSLDMAASNSPPLPTFAAAPAVGGLFLARPTGRPLTVSSEFSTNSLSSETTAVGLSPTSPFKRFFANSSTTSLSVSKAEKEAAKARAKAEKLDARANEMERVMYEAALREKLSVSKVHEEKAKKLAEIERAKAAAEQRKIQKKREDAERKRAREQFSYLGGML